ncbi:MAG: ATP-binding protein [Candidatus Korarchaeota archaeon]|nr:ATP-binding protein [Thermoproteota archaeon]MCR8471969.1 ATP-binding protein [Thermoproteota archaeon]MCR8473212.1 ATP-binding protein [Thermoproteota archaeon]MCR8488547.1 ATP-binding protein [Thermoproteota archaeon]
MFVPKVTVRGNFAIINLRGKISRQAIIMSKLIRFSHKDFSRAFEVLKNFLVQLSGLGGNFALVLARRNGIIDCNILVNGNFRLEKSLQNWTDSVASLLEALYGLSPIEASAVTSDISDSTLFLLPQKVLIYKVYQDIKIHELKKHALEDLRLIFQRSPNEYEICDLLRKELLMKYFWKDMSEGDIIIFLLDLGSIASVIRNTNKKLFDSCTKLKRRGLVDKKTPEFVSNECELKFGLYAGKILDPKSLTMHENLKNTSELNISVDVLHSFFQKTLNLALLVLGRQTKSLLKKRVMRSSTLLRVVTDSDYNVTVSGSLNTILSLLVAIVLIFMASKSVTMSCPQLDVSSGATRGDIHVGWQLQGCERVAPFYMKIEDLRRHVLILGRTGSGKTRLARIIIEQLLDKKNANIWIFDFHKEYLDLAQSGYFEVYEPGTVERPLCLNMFESAKEEPESYSTFLAAVLLETIRLKEEEVTAQMERALSYAVWSTVTSEEPNPKTFLRKLFDWCKSTESDFPAAMYTFYALTNRLKSLFSGVSKNIFWVYRSNIDVERLLEKNVIFDLSYLFKRNLKREILLLVNILMRYLTMTLFQRTKLVGDKEPPKLLVLIEEGRYLIPWRKINSTIETTAIEDFATLARKYGLGLIVLSQSPYLISSDIISNAGTIFLMNSEIPEREYSIIDDELRRFIQVMPPKQAIVKLSTEPTLVHVEIKHHEINTVSCELPSRAESLEMIEKDFEDCIREFLY